MQSAALQRSAKMLARRSRLTPPEAATYTREYLAAERAAFESIAGFAAVPDSTRRSADAFFTRLAAIVGASGGTPPAAATGDASRVYARNAAVSGPMIVFGYDYLADHTHGGAPPRLLSFVGARGTGADYAYEVLNFVNGKRSASQIRDMASAEFGPVDLHLVSEYLRALEAAGVVRTAK
jgi:hypothetical protein